MPRAKGKRSDPKKQPAKDTKEDVEVDENGEIVEGENPSPKVPQKPKEDSPISATGVLGSQYLSRDLKIDNFSLSLNGIELITDTRLEFNWGRRYGFIGLNGAGKSSLLLTLARREVPIPEHFKIYFLDKEVAASDKTSFEAVVEDLENESKELEKEVDRLVGSEEGSESERLMDVYAALDELEPETASKRAGEILHGLGFNKEMQNKKTKDFSGGWRMRIALAKALFVRPNMLLLDEPTNHLDLEACVWLEEYLKNYTRILVLVSHSQDFLNNVCTNILHLQKKKLTYYAGNFDSFVQTREEKEENQMKQFNWEQDQIKHMKDYIARFGHGSAKLARQAQSKEKTLAKMEAKGLTEKVTADKTLTFYFSDCGKLPPPVLTFTKVSFGYSPSKPLYKNLEFGVDLDSRVALVGPNGAGKSTLLKLMVGAITPTDGEVKKHSHLKIGWYHQHLTDQLDLNLSPLEYMIKCFPGNETEHMRRAIGKYGLSGKTQTLPIKLLSDGQKSRVVFAWLAFQEPHLLLLDEPTNHLDLETIDALAEAINNFNGGMVLVSHDFRLINQVAEEIWVCEHQAVTPWKGTIMEFKEMLRKKMLKLTN